MPVRSIKSVQDFDALVKAGTVVVDFYATWCGPCRQIKPVVEELSSKAEHSAIVFVQVDVDEVPELAEREDVSAMPTFKVFKNGKCEGTLVGANRVQLEDLVKKAL